jgi:glycyl-tRNA synthetase
LVKSTNLDPVDDGMDDLMEKLVALCKRRGFLFQSSEIYGGLNGFWDYGPLGVELKRNIKEAWWRDMVTAHDDLAPAPGAPGTHQMVGLDCSIIMNPKVWEASGHVGGFNDPMVDCKTCKLRIRADHVNETPCPRKPSKMAGQHGDCQLTEPRQFNLMFKTYVGALEDESAVAYLRPETAQGIFANFKNVLDTARVKLPFGIAQVGKAFRNEINPRNFTFRSREFEQMEIEFFCRPDEAPEWYTFWRDLRLDWYVKLGLNSDRLRLREHEADELAHYAAACADVEYAFPFGVSELEGVANRTDFDLSQHAKFSGKDLSYYDDQTKERFTPYVIEPSAGADRATLAFLCEAYTEDAIPNEKGVPQPRTVMKFHPRLAPIKAAVFPLVNRDGMPDVAEKIYRDLRSHGLTVFYDDKGAIGRRYRRQDEAGTPFCITVDSQTLQDQTVTFRDRDTCQQWRVAVSACAQELRARLDR